MKYLIIIVISIIFLLHLNAQDTDEIVRPYTDYPFYNLDLNIKPEKGTIEGNISIDILWTEKMESKNDSVYMLLLLNSMEEKNPYIFSFLEEKGPDGFSPSYAEISNVSVNSIHTECGYTEISRPVLIKYNTEHLIFEIRLPQKPELNETIHIEFNYKGQVSHNKAMDDFYFDDKMISRFSWFPYIVTEEQLDNAELTFPFFTYKADIDISKQGWEFAASGTDVNEYTHTYTSTKPVLSLPLLLLKNHDIMEFKLTEDNSIRVYFKENSENRASLILKYSAEILNYYAYTFFPLDYKYINIVQGNPGTWGMACDSTVIIGDGIFGDRGIPNVFNPLLHYILSHEIGHFYFGIGNESDFSRENYLSEGLSEYAGLKYHEYKYGIWNNLMSRSIDLAFLLIREITKEIIHSSSFRGIKYYNVVENNRSGWDSPLVQEPEDKILNSSSFIDYDRAYFVIYMLFNYLGSDNIDAALKSYLENNRYCAVDSYSLKSELENFYNKDLDLFFDTFVYDDGNIDYELSGTLNEEKEDSYISKIYLEDINNTGIFIPAKLTVFYEDGSEEERWINSPGRIEIESTKKIDYAGIDKDLTLLDYNRRNNFFPKQTYFRGTKDYWLSAFGASKWYLYPYIDSDDDYIFLGYGPRYRNPFKFALKSAPFLGIPSTSFERIRNLDFVFAAGLEGIISLPHSNILNFKTRYIYPDRFSLTEFGYLKRFYLDTDLGFTGHTYLPAISLGTSIGLADFLTDEPDYSYTYLFNKLTFELDLINKCGHRLFISNQVNYFYSGKSFENRISAGIIQGVPFIPRTFLSFRLTGTVSMGELIHLGASNSVLGFSSEADNSTLYSVKFRSFLGIPGFNNIEISLMNWIVLQSINFGITYEGACAFSGKDEIRDGIQQAIGFEIIPCFRTVADLAIPVSIGISFNLTDIIDNPKDGQSYIPGFYIGISPESALFNSVAAY